LPICGRNFCAHYQNNFQYSVNVRKEEPNDCYIFYEAPNGKEAEFYAYCKDVIDYYLEQAFASKIGFNKYGDDDEIEMHIFIYIENKRPLVIYLKHTYDRGLRGFGVTFDEKNLIEDVNNYLGNMIYNNKNFNMKKVNKLSYKDMHSGFIYTNYQSIQEESTYILTKVEEYNGLSFSIKNEIIENKTISNDYEYNISLKIHDIKLKDDNNFTSQFIELSDGIIYSFEDLISNEKGINIFSENSIIGVTYRMWDKSEIIAKYINAFEITVKVCDSHTSFQFCYL